MRRFILNDEQLSRAQDRAGELIREFGMYAYATDTDKRLRSMLSQCAGSRVGNTCNKISVSWPGCDIAVGNGAGNDTDRLPSVGCLRVGSLGLTSYNVMPSTIRAVRKCLDDYIAEYNPGQVELGDFELIAGSASAAAEN